MKKIFIPLLILLAPACFAQTFFVSGRDPKSCANVIDKIKFEGYRVVSDSASADYVVELLLEGHYQVVSLKQPYHGYIKISNRATGEEVTRSKVIGRSPAVLNGYNASYTIFSVISKRYLADELKQCKKIG